MAVDAALSRPKLHRVCRRPDLVAVSRNIRGSRRWIVKDPVSLAYFDLSEAEYMVLTLLDGQTSGEEILARLKTSLTTSISREQLETFVKQLLRQSLAVGDAVGPAVMGASQPLLSRFSGLFSLRLRGINPTWLLQKFDWLQQIVFSRGAGVFAVALMMFATLLVTTRFDEIFGRMPRLQSVFSGNNLVWLALVWLITKVIHELAHGLTCRYFGGRCREAGVMLLFLTPCLYCDVSDSWMFRSRWQRVAVSAAGIVVELLLASLGVILWYFSEPGLFNSLCLNVMIISSVGAVAFNGNPLLRYDGYYILSDLIEVPNLREKADAAVRDLFRRLVHGVDTIQSRVTPRLAFSAFSVASFAYRTLVIVAIVSFIDAIAEPYGFSVITVPLGIVSALGLLHALVAALFQEMRLTSEYSQRRFGRRHFVLLSLVGLVLIGLLVPLPRGVRAAAVIEPHDLRHVYVTVPGTLIEARMAGSHVRTGDILGRLQNLELERKLIATRGNVTELERRLDDLIAMRTGDSKVAAAFEPLAARIAGLRDELKGLESEYDRLTLRAPRSGIVLPPPVLEREATEVELPAWTGTPVDPENQRAFLETGTLFCIIGDSSDVCALALLDQEDVEFIVEGQWVRVVADHRRDVVLRGVVAEVAKVEVDTLPVELVGDPEVESRRSLNGLSRPAHTSYLARVQLDERDGASLAKGKASLRISVASEPLFKRIYRALRRTFRVRL